MPLRIEARLAEITVCAALNRLSGSTVLTKASASRARQAGHPRGRRSRRARRKSQSSPPASVTLTQTRVSAGKPGKATLLSR